MCVHALLCLIFCDPMDYGPPGSSVHGIFQARAPEWVAISYSKGSSQPRDRTSMSLASPALADGFFTNCATSTKEDMTIVNINAFNIEASQYIRQMLTIIKGD